MTAMVAICSWLANPDNTAVLPSRVAVQNGDTAIGGSTSSSATV